MYPVLKEGVSLRTFQYKGSNTTHYYIENAEGVEFEIGCRLWDALLHADGTHPLNLPDNGRRVLPKLKRYGLVRTSRFVRGAGIFNSFILFPISNRSNRSRSLFKAINAALPVTAILAFAIGIYLMASHDTDAGGFFSWWLYYGLIVCSLLLHEAGHLIAGLAYNYKISDTGILLMGIIPVGAYVAHEDKKDATKTERIQFSLAGIEMNLLIAGICIVSAMQCYQLSLTLLCAANINIVLAFINLLPASRLDGESALSAVCEIKSISKLAEKCLASKKRRQKLLRSGLTGYACFFLFLITRFSKAILWMLIGLDVMSAFFHAFDALRSLL